MKRFITILGVLSFLTIFTSCEDFLKEDPKTLYTMENAFEKSSQVDAQIIRAYAAFYQLHAWGTSFFSEMNGAASTLGGYGADTIEGNGEVANSFSGFSNYSLLNSLTPRFLSTWNALYQLASYANLALQGAEQVEWSNESEKAYLMAQAKFFVGWAYLRLAECYGGVPIVDKFDVSLKFDYVRNTREEVYGFAIKCFEEAATALPDYPVADGRLAKGAVYHYLAEAYIAQGVETEDTQYYTKAVTAANQVISLHPLMTERFGSRANPADTGTSNGVPNYRPDGNVFYDLFQIGNYNRSEGNTEAILVMQTPTYAEQSESGGAVYQLGTITGYPYRGMLWNEKYQTETSKGPWSANIDNSKYSFGTGCAYLGGNTWGLIGSTHYLDRVVWEDKFGDDMRNAEINLCHPVCLDTTHPLYGQIVTDEMIQTNNFTLQRISAKVKMQDDWGWDPHHTMFGQSYMIQYGRDWYAARSSETYLLKAEAQMRLGDNASAAETINVVRKRADASYMLTAGDIDIYTILDERVRELSWEEHRWPTLLRLAKSGTDNDVMHHQIMNHAMFVVDMPAYTGGTPEWSLFPIPGTVIQLNTDAVLEQNKGWK